MDTNYGQRPGVEPLAVDGDREYWRSKVAELDREIVGLTHERDVARLACENVTAMRDAAQAELDAERAAHAATLAALEGLMASLGPGPKACGHDCATCICATDAANAAIAQARGGRS